MNRTELAKRLIRIAKMFSDDSFQERKGLRNASVSYERDLKNAIKSLDSAIRVAKEALDDIEKADREQRKQIGSESLSRIESRLSNAIGELYGVSDGVSLVVDSLKS